MRKTRLLTTLLLLCFPADIPGETAEKYVVIVNKANRIDSLTSSKLRFIYQRKVSRWPWGAEILPLDLPEQSPVRHRFASSVLGSSIEDLAVYWIDQKITRNVNPPTRVSTPNAAKSIVAARAGAIAYIPVHAVDPTVKVLEVR